jgi:hypothetical protein
VGLDGRGDDRVLRLPLRRRRDGQGPDGLVDAHAWRSAGRPGHGRRTGHRSAVPASTDGQWAQQARPRSPLPALGAGHSLPARKLVPKKRGPGAVYDGWGTALDTSIGRTLRPGFTVGGRWQFAAVVDANESYRGATYVVTQTARLLDTIAIFVNDFPNPRGGFHFGGSVGVLAASNLDTVYGTVSTGWGAAVSGDVGYERSLSNYWSVGVLAGLAAYRYWESEVGVSSTSDGLMPTLALSFRFE